ALATVGIIVAVVATVALIARGVPTLAMVCLVWLQGLILLAIRRQSRADREHLVRKLRIMLQDRVNNQLTVLVGLTDIRAHAASPDDRDDAELALTAARAVSREIETLSIESLRSWEARYAKHLPAPLR
ncbi:MAG: hypothetical protein ACREL3_08360, partial [Gemmatimonadales bacterium]